MPHTITPAERQERDYLRRRGLATGAVYESRLRRLRRKELRRVLDMANATQDPNTVAGIIRDNLTEDYLNGWWQGLYIAAGLPMARTTAKQLRQQKAAAEDTVWTAALRSFATQRAGTYIRIVSGTWKDLLLSALSQLLLDEDVNFGVERLTRELYSRWTGVLERWECRRIAQTETMIGMADAADQAAKTLDVKYTKQWAISGLGNTRESHELMDGVEVDQNDPFQLPGGLLMYPHDTSMGADAAEIVNCACDCIRRPK